jgi:hypothetical protein
VLEVSRRKMLQVVGTRRARRDTFREASRNGVTVNGRRAAAVRLDPATSLWLGDVGLYFWPEPITPVERPSGRGRTAPLRPEQIAFLATVVTPRGHLVDLRQRVAGGVVRAGDRTVELAAMEFGLVQALISRRRLVGDPDHAYMAWHEIAATLSFKSDFADSENVRELVRRVRRKFATVGADDLIESRRGIGYRLAGKALECTVDF